MNDPDDSLEVLRHTIQEFKTFVEGRGTVSEADTRSKLIDKVLVEVCGWPELAITREEHVESGYIDYLLKIQSRPYVLVEAKKEGIASDLPPRN